MTNRDTGLRVRIRIGLQWRAHGRTGRSLIVVGLGAATLLAGAFAFGVWHVLFGGLAKANWRAGSFGFVLAAVSGALLAVEVAIWRRLARRSQQG